MTSDDLVRLKRTFAEKSFYGTHQKNLNEDGHKRSAAKYRSTILVSEGFPIDRGRRMTVGFSKNGDAQTFPSKFPTLKPTLFLLYSNTQSLVGFSVIPKCVTVKLPLNVIEGVLCWLWRQMRPRQQGCRV